MKKKKLEIKSKTQYVVQFQGPFDKKRDPHTTFFFSSKKDQKIAYLLLSNQPQVGSIWLNQWETNIVEGR